MSLADRGYVAGVHPLELWLVELSAGPSRRDWNEVLDASARCPAGGIYGWLFNGNLHKQDTRIRILIEQDAFQPDLGKLAPLGYPFGHLVPSLGTAIGASGDRPDALAELMGVIMNDGVRMPTDLDRAAALCRGHALRDGHEALTPSPSASCLMRWRQVAKRALTGVVQEGTARRLIGTYKAADGTPICRSAARPAPATTVIDHFGAGGGIIGSRVVDRTGTFVFFLGDRFFGTVTAYVPGPEAARFSFTSGLAVQLLKSSNPSCGR